MEREGSIEKWSIGVVGGGRKGKEREREKEEVKKSGA